MARKPSRRDGAGRPLARGIACGLGLMFPSTLAYTPAEARPPRPIAAATAAEPTWVEAIRATQATGVPSVLVVTSGRVPSSKAVMPALLASPASARLKGRVTLAEISAEAEPKQVGGLRVGYPSVVVFRRGRGGQLERGGTYSGAPSAEELVGWLIGQGVLSQDRDASDSTPQPAADTAAEVDPAVSRASFGHEAPVQPSAQVAPPPPPMIYSPPPPPVPYIPPQREVVVERPVERRVVREVVPRRRRVVVEREVAAPEREVEVVREVSAPRRMVREIEVEETPAPRNILTRPREVVREVEAPPREVVREVEAPPREVVREVEVPTREVVREVEAPPREVVREVEVAPRRVVAAAPARELAIEAPREAGAPAMTVVQPGFLGRGLGAIGRQLARRGQPRAYLEVETQRVYRAAAPEASARLLVPTTPAREAQVIQTVAVPAAAPVCVPQPTYAPQPAYAPPPYAPSPQSAPPPVPMPSPQGR